MKRLILLVSLSAPIGATAALAQLHPYNPHGAYTFDQVITGSLNATGGTLSGVAVDNATVNGVPLKTAISSAAGLTPAQASTLANALTSAAIGQTVAGLTNNVVPPINMPAFTGDITSNAGSTATSLAATGVSAGVCLKPTVDTKGRATGCAALAPTDLPSSTQAAIGQAQTALQPDSGGHLPAAAAPALTGDVTSTAGSTATLLAATGVSAGVCLKPTVDAKGRATGCAALAPTDLPSSTQAAIGQAQTALQPDSGGHLPATAAPALTGDVTSAAGSTVTSLASTGVPAGTCLKPTVDAKGRATGCAALAPTDIPANIPAADLTNAPYPAQANGTTPGLVPNLGGLGGALKADANGTASSNTQTANWAGAVPRALMNAEADELNVKDFKCASINYVCASIDPDDTLSFQRAITLATTTNLGFHVYVPSGVYYVSTTLKATINGNSGLHITGPGSGEAMIVFQQAASATDFNGFEFLIENAVGNGLNAPWRSNGQNGQFLTIEHLTLEQNEGMNHPAGDAINVTANYSANAGSVLPFLTTNDVTAVGSSANGYDSWLNPIHLLGVPSANITNLNAQPGQAYYSTVTPMLGVTIVDGVGNGKSGAGAVPSSKAFVAGACVLAEASQTYGNTSGGIFINGGQCKGFMAALAFGGQGQAIGENGMNVFGDNNGVAAGGDYVLDQLSGSTIHGYASNPSPGNSTITLAPSVTVSPSASVASGAWTATFATAPAVYYGEPVADTTTTASLSAGTFVMGISGNTVTFSTPSAAAIPTTDSLSFAFPAPSVGETVLGSYMGTTSGPDTIKSISGNILTLQTPSGTAPGLSYGFGVEPVTFTNGDVLNTPGNGENGIGMAGGCDVYHACIAALSDTDTSYGWSGVTTAGDLSIIMNDASLDDVAIQLGQGDDHVLTNIQVVNSASAGPSGSPLTQAFLQDVSAIGSNVNSTGVLENDSINIQDAQPQIQLGGFTNFLVNGVQIISTGTVLGTDTTCQSQWGVNTVNGAMLIGLPGCNNSFTIGKLTATSMSWGNVSGHQPTTLNENLYAGYGTMTTNGSNAATTSALGPLVSGNTVVEGKEYCSAGSNDVVWHVVGTWKVVSGSLTNVTFQTTVINQAAGYTVPTNWTLSSGTLAGGTAGTGYPEILLASSANPASGSPLDCTFDGTETPNQ